MGTHNETLAGGWREGWVEGRAVLSILLPLLAVLLSLVTIFGNLLVMVSFKIDSNLQSVSNLLLVSLSVADFTIGAVSMPLFSSYLLLGTWPFGSFACDLWLSIDYTVSNASVASLLLITFDRYFSVTRPLSYRVHRTAKKAIVSVIIAWIVSALLWTPWIFLWPYFEGVRKIPDGKCFIQFLVSSKFLTILTAIAAFFLPVCIMAAIFVRIFLETKKRTVKLGNLQQLGKDNSKTKKNNLSTTTNLKINSTTTTNKTNATDITESNVDKSKSSNKTAETGIKATPKEDIKETRDTILIPITTASSNKVSSEVVNNKTNNTKCPNNKNKNVTVKTTMNIIKNNATKTDVITKKATTTSNFNPVIQKLNTFTFNNIKTTKYETTTIQTNSKNPTTNIKTSTTDLQKNKSTTTKTTTNSTTTNSTTNSTKLVVSCDDSVVESCKEDIHKESRGPVHHETNDQNNTKKKKDENKTKEKIENLNRQNENKNNNQIIYDDGDNTINDGDDRNSMNNNVNVYVDAYTDKNTIGLNKSIVYEKNAAKVIGNVSITLEKEEKEEQNEKNERLSGSTEDTINETSYLNHNFKIKMGERGLLLGGKPQKEVKFKSCLSVPLFGSLGETVAYQSFNNTINNNGENKDDNNNNKDDNNKNNNENNNNNDTIQTDNTTANNKVNTIDKIKHDLNAKVFTNYSARESNPRRQSYPVYKAHKNNSPLPPPPQPPNTTTTTETSSLIPPARRQPPLSLDQIVLQARAAIR